MTYPRKCQLDSLLAALKDTALLRLYLEGRGGGRTQPWLQGNKVHVES